MKAPRRTCFKDLESKLIFNPAKSCAQRIAVKYFSADEGSLKIATKRFTVPSLAGRGATPKVSQKLRKHLSSDAYTL